MKINLISKKNWYFLFSGIIIVPGIISLVLFGVRPAIDFTGGTLLEIRNSKFEIRNSEEEVKKIIEDEKLELGAIQKSGSDTYLLRLKPIKKEQNQKLLEALKSKYPDLQEVRFESVGPSVGRETTLNAAKSVAVASLAIIFYIAWAFRSIPKPYSSWKFGIAAVAALIHDVLLLIGIFSLLGHFYQVEIDGLFITALLTVMGFSVHDTIVVFDRIRENLLKMTNDSFPEVVNESLVQTLARSLSTSLTVVFTLSALLLFGGESIRWFVAALLIGIVSGTYSSIFNAAPLLVLWDEWDKKRKIAR